MEQYFPLIVLGVVALIVLGVLWYILTRFLVNIGAKEVGIKERRYFGRRMPQGRVVATDGEVGIQADVLKPGLHFVMYPVERVTQKVPLVEIGADELGVIEAVDGEVQLSSNAVLAGYELPIALVETVQLLVTVAVTERFDVAVPAQAALEHAAAVVAVSNLMRSLCFMCRSVIAGPGAAGAAPGTRNTGFLRGKS